jgi:hypothetical protein
MGMSEYEEKLANEAISQYRGKELSKEREQQIREKAHGSSVTELRLMILDLLTEIERLRQLVPESKRKPSDTPLASLDAMDYFGRR